MCVLSCSTHEFSVEMDRNAKEYQTMVIMMRLGKDLLMYAVQLRARLLA